MDLVSGLVRSAALENSPLFVLLAKSSVTALAEQTTKSA